MEYSNFEQLLNQTQGKSGKSVMAVAEAANAHVISAVVEATEKGIVKTILVGNVSKIKELLREHGASVSDYDIMGPSSGMNAAETVVELVKGGEADSIMKGMLETSDLLRPIVKRENNLRTGRTMSHVVIYQLPFYHKLIVTTDGGMCAYPNLQNKKDIIINAVDTLHKIGYECPKAAVLCCKETVDPNMVETTDARALREMYERGELGNCFVEGPISYDLAFSRERAEVKKFDCPHSGNFDIIVQPNIHAGNILGKCWELFPGATLAGIIVGARVPVIMTSRGASAREKLLSITIASLVSRNQT